MLLSNIAYAHPPSAINLKFDKAKAVYKLTVNHRIAGKGHFIKEIRILLNGQEIQSQTFTFQINKSIVSYSFPKPEHKKEDILTIEVTCNRTGLVTRDFPLDSIKTAKESSSY
jgi:hypothetical protein